MGWKEMDLNQLAKSLGVSPSEVREKHKLIQLIIATRKKRGFSQAVLAKKIGVSQSRIAQIESGIGTAKITFDVLLNILSELGYDFEIETKKAA